MLYRICDFTLESNIELPDLVKAQKEVGELTKFHLHNYSFEGYEPFTLSRQIKLQDDRVYLIIAKHSDERYLLQFPWRADFVISDQGRKIDCYPLSKFDLDTIIHFLLNQVVPCMLSQRGEMVLHASAVAVEDKALAFVGRSGEGKSTLCASFYQQGFPLITDDYLLVKRHGDRYLGYPSYPGFRLWRESRLALSLEVEEDKIKPNYKGKDRIQAAGKAAFSLVPSLVQGLYILSSPDDENNKEGIQISPIPLRDAFMEILYASYYLDTSDQNINKEGFNTISRAADSLDVFRLSYPREISKLSKVRSTVLQHLKSG